ncbi:hypothetical protein BDV95DRAFT_562773 [Massariosphaeria phaeospora]|uniref:Uncharacterized protein n=1 Tax=Massariosphaeria phaeospora TaxID=100035 RepID=A0A7C8IBZ9_9PLEO|nr:hypothetical protein BDV95DRAFT_562773 [Massariosphaeria phaeospora]
MSHANSKEFIPVDEFAIGLDRSNINNHNQIQIAEQHPRTSSGEVLHQGNDKHEAPESTSHHVFSSIKERKHEVAIKLRKTLHISKATDSISADAPILANSITENPEARLVHQLPPADKHGLKELLHDPVDTVKSKVSGQGNHQIAANIAAKEIPHGQEVELVKAQTAVDRARTEREKLLAIEDLSKLMKERQSTFVRWTLDRHITKVRVLPKGSVVKKSRSAFETINPSGDVVIDWRAYGEHLLNYYAHQYGGQYIGFGSNPPAPSKETIMPNIERLIVASSPFQEFIMTTRRVYRWEDPAETSKYLLIYLTLWYFNLLLPGVLSALMYLVVERRFHGNTIEDLREDIKHREDVDRTALSLTEYIEKKGDEKWADDLLEGVGPWLMVQLADMANFFESIRNFYEWRVPSRTMSTLGVLAFGILATALTPVWLLIKIMTLSAGVTFFALFPIATNFPEYRLLVSPTKRLLWNIPTHSEWAIKVLQAEGTRYDEEHEVSRPLAELPPAPGNQQDYGAYKGHHDGDTGHIVVGNASVRFVSRTGHKLHFVLAYDQINNVEKVDRVVGKTVPKPKTDSGKDLRLVTKAGHEFLVKNLDKRDVAFSQIVGFSQTTWQVVW